MLHRSFLATLRLLQAWRNLHSKYRLTDIADHLNVGIAGTPPSAYGVSVQRVDVREEMKDTAFIWSEGCGISFKFRDRDNRRG